MARCENPADPLNGPEYHTGQKCVEKGCNNPAGTHWSPFWCQPCNAKRLGRVSASLSAAVRASVVKTVRPPCKLDIADRPDAGDSA